MTVVSDIEIRLRADIAQLRNDMLRARRDVDSSVSSIKKSLLSLAAGFSLVEIARQVIQAQREFDKLNASLVTATGSSKAAGEAMKALQDFAARTPFSLQEVTEGFLKLRNLGLTPSERALESYGNTSAAMGKSLTQLVEAVADATTGEFERLKEFGIKAKQQGDSVALTFQGTTTKIGNNAAEIEEYLTKIGEVNFAGGMTLQANTLDGELSRLGDTWSQTLVAFSQSGFGDAVRSGVMTLSGALEDLQAMFKAVTGAADDESKKVEEIGPVHALLTTFFEAMLVTGINVAHILKTIGGDIGAIGAAVVAFAKGDFAQAREIIQMRIKDGEAELADVNARSAAILGAAKKAREARAQEETERAKNQQDRLAGYKIQSEQTKSLSDAEVKAAAKAKQAYDELAYGLQKRVDATARELAGLAPLTAAEQAHLDLTERLTLGKIKLTAEQEKRARALIDEAGANDVLVKSNAEWQKLQQAMIDSAAELTAERTALIKSAKDEAEQNEFLAETFGMTEAAVIRLQAARLLEQEAQRLGRELTVEEIADLERVIELKERSAQAVADRAELEAAKTFWTDIEKTARDTFVSIADGGKNAFQRLKDTAKNVFFDWLYQQTLKKWIINIGTQTSGASIAQALGGSSASSGGGFGNASNLISIGKTIYSGFSTGLAGSLGSTISSLGSMFGSQAVSAFGAGLTGSSLGATTALGSSGYAGTAAAGAGASAGAYAIPIAGWIAAGMTVANKLYKQGWDATNGTLNTAGKVFGSSILAFNSVLKKIGLSNTAANIFSGQATLSKLFGRKNPEIEASGIQGTFNAAGFTGQNFANILEKGGWFRSDKRYSRSADLTAEQQSGFSNTITSMLDAVRGFGSALGAEVSVLNSYSKQIKLTLTKDEAENEKLIAGLFAGIGDELAVMLVPTIARFSAEGETAAATLERVANNFLAIDAVLDVLGVTSQTAFRAVGVASIEARERLIAATGGLEAFAAQVDFFNQNFLSAAEQVAPLQRQVNEQLAVLGYSSVKTADQFKAAVQGLVQSGALATAEGAKTYAGLLALAPAFKTVTDYLNDINEAARQTLRSRADADLAALEKSVNAQKDEAAFSFERLMSRIDKSIDGLGDSISRATDLSRALKDSMVGVDAPGQAFGMRAAAQAQIQAAIESVKAGGALPSTDDLRDALAALQQDSSGQFGSLADYQREVARTNNQLSDLGGLTDEQLSIAERQLKALQEQRDQATIAHEAELARLDNLVLFMQTELGLINGVNPAILTVTAAVKQVEQTLRELRSTTPGAINPGIDTAPPVFEVFYPDDPSVSTNEALLTEMRAMNARLAAIEDSNQQTANATRQQADQINQISGGGNALVVEMA